MGAAIFWGVVLLAILVGGWWYRYTKIKEMADLFGLDKGDLMLKDIFGHEGAVEQELATVAFTRAEEANRRADSEAATRRRDEAKRKAAEREAELAKQAVASQAALQGTDRPRDVRLQELNDLEQRGLITTEVAAARRAEILGEI
jgi:hypothetical protein